MGEIVLKVSDEISYENLNKNRLELVKFLTQKGLPITMSYCIDVRQNDIVVEKVESKGVDSTTPDVSGSTTPNVSGA
jgi:hypothetical protein